MKRRAERVMRARRIGRSSDGGLEQHDRVPCTALLLVSGTELDGGGSQILQCRRITRPQRERRTETVDCAGMIALIEQRRAEIAVRFRGVRLQPDRKPKAVRRCREVSAALERDAEAIGRVGERRLTCQRRAIGRYRSLEVAHREQRAAESVVKHGVTRVDPDRALQHRDRFLLPPDLRQRNAQMREARQMARHQRDHALELRDRRFHVPAREQRGPGAEVRVRVPAHGGVHGFGLLLFRQAASLALQTSSPKPSTNTSSQPSAVSASGAGASVRAAFSTEDVAEFVALLRHRGHAGKRRTQAARLRRNTGGRAAHLDVVEPDDLRGRDVEVGRPRWMPASPAFTVPAGAMRSTLPSLAAPGVDGADTAARHGAAERRRPRCPSRRPWWSAQAPRSRTWRRDPRRCRPWSTTPRCRHRRA